MVTTPWSENSPLQGINFPRGGCSGVENSLNNLGWETWVYELGPLRGQAHSFQSSGCGWNIEPPAWDRRSLLTGSSRGGTFNRPLLLQPQQAPHKHETDRSICEPQDYSLRWASATAGPEPWGTRVPSLWKNTRQDRSVRKGSTSQLLSTDRACSSPKQATQRMCVSR